MTAHSLRRIFMLALDIKVPDKGPIQILEFMAGHHAGYKGYTQLEGKDMITEHVLPHLWETHPGVVVEQIGRTRNFVPLPRLGEDYGFALAEKGSGILYPSREMSGGFCHLSRSDLQFTRRYPEFTFVNADQQMLLTEGNKAAQACLVEEDEVLKSLYTPTLITTTSYDEDKAGQILRHFDHDGYYVVKPVDQSQGNGVRIVAADDLDGWFEKTFVKKRKFNMPRVGVDYWMTDINPVCLVQPYIVSRAVDYKGHNYDGTLRVFVTIQQESPEQDWSVKIHDGYWKLPSKPLQDGRAQNKERISHSPDRKESSSAVLFVSAVLLNRMSYGLIPFIGPSVWRGRMNSAGLTDQLREEIYPQVEKFCARLPVTMQRKSLYQRTWDHLSSDDAVRQGVGLSMATDSVYFPGGENDPLPLNAKSGSDGILSRIEDLCLKENFNSNVSAYMYGLIKSPLGRNYAAPLDKLIKNPQFTSRILYQHEGITLRSFVETMAYMMK